MKHKLGTLLEEKVMRLAKRRAAEEGRPLNELIQDALVRYLREHAPSPQEREIAYHVFCQTPLTLTPGQFRHVLEEDPWAP
jgi:hypothetical protein